MQLLCLIECAMSGLAEKEIPSLLSDPAEQQPVPLMTWASLRLALKPYIRSVSLWTPSGPTTKVRFFHEEFSQVSHSFFTYFAVQP